MTLLNNNSFQPLTEDEHNELCALRSAINHSPSQVCPSKMEKYTQLMVKSIQAKLPSDNVPDGKLNTPSV